jgi:hypothetical protein
MAASRVWGVLEDICWLFVVSEWLLLLLYGWGRCEGDSDTFLARGRENSYTLG